MRHHEPVELADTQEFSADLTHASAAQTLLAATKPEFVVHCAAFTDVDACEIDPDRARELNVATTAALVRATAESGARFIFISTDQLWDGLRPMLTEGDQPSPINVYGRTKYEAEQAALAADDHSLVLRVNFFGGGRPGHPTFSDWIRSHLEQKRRLTLFDDVFFTPIEAGLLCDNLANLAEAGASGIFHLVGAERLSKYEFGLRLAHSIGLDPSPIVATSLADAGLTARRPADMSLSSAKISAFLARPMPDIEESLSRIKTELD